MVLMVPARRVPRPSTSFTPSPSARAEGQELRAPRKVLTARRPDFWELPWKPRLALESLEGRHRVHRTRTKTREQETRTFRGSSMKHGLRNRVLGWKGQGVERDQSWTPGSRRREGNRRSIPSARAQELPEDMERNGEHWGTTLGSQGGRTSRRPRGPCREHPGKSQSTGSRRKHAAMPQGEDQGCWEPGQRWAAAAGQGLASSREGSFQSEVSNQPGSGTLSRRTSCPRTGLLSSGCQRGG